MARIALVVGMALAGAAISVATGGLGTFAVGAWVADIAAGASVGATVGNLLGQIFFPGPKPQQPLNDLQAMSSAPGMPIPWGYGHYRIGGQMIWAEQLKPVAWQQGGGGKGGGASSTVWGYLFTGALSFGYGPGNILRIWADSKLIYDVTSKTPIALDSGFTHHNGTQVTSPFLPTIYTGTSTQLPDPVIQASLGVGSTPAFRDQIYFVVENMPLGDFGNRIPNFRAEISTGSIQSFIKDLYPGTDIPSFTGLNPGGIVLPPGNAYVDSAHRVAYVADQAGQVFQKVELDDVAGAVLLPWQGLTVYKLGMEVLDSNGNVQLVIRNHTSAGPSSPPAWQTGEGSITQVSSQNTWKNLGPGPTAIVIASKGSLTAPFYTQSEGNQNVDPVNSCGIDTAGYIWACGAIPNAGSFQFNMIKFDPNTFAMIARIPIVTGFRISSCTFIKSANTGTNYIYCTTTQDHLMIVIDADTNSIVATGKYLSSVTAAQAIASPTPVCVDPNTGVAYVLSYDNTTSPSYTTWVNVCDPRSGIITPVSYALPTAQAISNQYGQASFFDTSDSTLLVWVTPPSNAAYNGSDLWKFDIKQFGLIAQTTGGPVDGSNNYYGKFSRAYNCTVPSSSIIKLPRTPVIGVSGFAYIDTSTMTVEFTVAITEWLVAGFSSFDCAAYDALSDSLVFTDLTGNYAGVGIRIYFDRQAVSSAFLSDIISDLWAKSGADPARLDVTRVAGITVLGYPITQITNPRSAISPLAGAYFFDMVETDNVLVAIPRGQAVSTIIPESDLGVASEKFKLTPTIQQENDLPRTMIVNFSNPALDYQQDKQQFQRNARVKKTRNEQQVSFPIVMDADTAVQIAAEALALTWMEKDSYEFKLWKSIYLTLDPSDVIQFTYNGLPYQSRIVKINAGQDTILEVSAVSEDPRTYESSAVSAPNPNFNTGAITAVGPSALFVLDTPFISDADNDAPGNTGYYYLMSSPVLGLNWPGAALYVSTDGKTWPTSTVADTIKGTFGSVVAATPAPPQLFSWDFETQITIRLSQGTLSSTSMINVLNGANLFYLGGEQMAFVNAVLNSDGSYTLSTLLRGLRGTEWACSTHLAGETFLLLDIATFRQQVPTTFIGLLQYFRGVTIGNLVASATSQIVELEGNDLKPYAPAQFTGSAVGGVHGDIDMTWVRRTRVGGAWLDGIGTVPLSEETESYDVDICPDANNTQPNYTISANPVRISLIAGNPAYNDIIVNPFTITWEDGVTASYPGYDFLAGGTGFVCVNDPTRVGGAGASYSVEYGDYPPVPDGCFYLGFVDTQTGTVLVGGRDAAIRTIAGLPTPAAVYTGAQQVSDFGITDSLTSVRARVFQNSASVGRGFAADNANVGGGSVISGGSDATSILGVPITGSPNDGDFLQYNSSLNEWVIVGPLLKRQSKAKTTGSLAANGTETGTWALGCGTFALLKVAVSGPARVELYSTAALRDADGSRGPGFAPSAGLQNGIIADIVLNEATTWDCSTPILGANVDSPSPADQVYYRITNLSGGSAALTVTLTIVPLEVV